MALTPEPIERQLLDNIKTILEAYVVEQVALNPSVGFSVGIEGQLPKNQQQLPAVMLYLDSVDADRAAVGSSGTFTATVRIELIASEPAGTVSSDSASAYRVLYLYQQVRTALFRRENYDLLFEPGTIGKRGQLSYQHLDADKSESRERKISAAVCTMDVQYRVVHEVPDYPALETLSLDEEKIKLTITYP